MSSAAPAVLETEVASVPAASAGVPGLSRSTAVTYALPILGAGVMWNMIGFYFLKYATDVLLVAPGLVGLIFGAARLWDAISDPLAGYWSDRTRSRLGRRRPWMLASALPLAVCFVALWLPPAALSQPARVAWITVATFLFYTALTVFRIPHLSLGAELVRGYHDRTRIFAATNGADISGGLIGIGFLVLVTGAGAAPDAVANRVGTIALGTAAATAVLVTACALRLREPPPGPQRIPGLRAAFRDVWRNPHARWLLAIDFPSTIGLVATGTCAPYLAEYVLEDAGTLPIILLAFALSAVASLPLCVPLSRRLGKRGAWMLGRSLEALALLGLYAAPSLEVWQISALAAAAGMGEGVAGVLMRSLQADVIDWDERRTGERKQGTYFSVWNLATKTALGLAVLAVGSVLQLAGFVPGAAQQPSSQVAIRATMSVFPCVLLLGSVALFTRFRLEEPAGVRSSPRPPARPTSRG